MIDRIITWSVHHRWQVTLAAAVWLVAAWFAWRATPVHVVGDLADVHVVVTAAAPGLAPDAVEDQVTHPLTSALLGVPTARAVRGYSTYGQSVSIVAFPAGTDTDIARARVTESLDVAARRLPEGVTTRLGPAKAGGGAIYQTTLSDFGPRARRMRQILDLDGDGVVTEAELPEPDEILVAQATGECAVPTLLRWCGFPEIQPLAEPLPVYSDRVISQLARDSSVSPQPGSDAREPIGSHSGMGSFDRDRDGRISTSELLAAANFTGLDLSQLRTVQDFILRDALTRLPGVADVATIGGLQKEYRVDVDPERLRAYGVSLAQVSEALRRSSQDVGGQVLELGEAELFVRSAGSATGVEDLLAVPVGMDQASRTPILLAQVARVHIGPGARRGLADRNGIGEVVGGLILIRPGAHPRAVIDSVEVRLAELVPTLPQGVEVYTSYSHGSQIDATVDNLQRTAIEQMVIVVLLFGLFLLHLRSALVAAVTVPAGVASSLAVLWLVGLPANIMSLAGIALGIALLLDAVVVLLDRAHAHREQRPDAPADQVAISAAIEVGPALMVSLLVMSASFLPALMWTGGVGRLYAPAAWTLIIATGVGAFLVLTVLPAVVAWAVGRATPASAGHPVAPVAHGLYRPLLRALTTPFGAVMVIGAAAVLLVSQVPVHRSVANEFMPPLDEDHLLYAPTAPPGISIAKARELLQQTDRLLAAHPQVAHVFGTAGRSDASEDIAPLSTLTTTLRLTPRPTWPAGKNLQDVIDELDTQVTVPGLSNGWTTPIRGGLDLDAHGVAAPVIVQVMGDDLAQVERVAQQIARVAQGVPGTGQVNADAFAGVETVDISVRREQAARFGLTVADVQEVVQAATGGTAVTWTVEGIERYPVMVGFGRDRRQDMSALARTAVPTPMGHTVPLAQVADLSIRPSPPGIRTEDGRVMAVVQIWPNHDDVNDLVARTSAAIDTAVVAPAGVSVQWSRGVHGAGNPGNLAGRWAAVGIVLLLLLTHFRGMGRAALTLAAMSLASAGGWWCVWLAGSPASGVTHIGLMALSGLAGATTVMTLTSIDAAVDRARRARSLTDLAALRSAIERGAADRLRPVLMTTTTALLVLLPMVLGHETGTTVMRRLALPLVAGLGVSAAVALLVVPAVYAAAARRRFTPQQALATSPLAPRPDLATPGVAAVRVRGPTHGDPRV